MRLLEVDEAANHIRELVDEDANIIWGSAFNPDLEGKIRVSVVATGIEADAQPAVAAPAPTRAFSFSAPKAAEPAPAPVAAPEPVAAEPEAAAEPAPVAEETPVADEPLPIAAADADELVLGSESEVAPAPKPLVFGDDEPAAEVVPEAPAKRRWLSGGSPAAEAEPAPEPVAPAPRVKLGGTLFERMSSVSRNAAREDEAPADKDAVEIPRFLHRQNNQ
jgi:cell division protein FtsZ